MQDEADFFQAICADPENISLRLVCADWFEERGNSRAEFIRIQCMLATMEPTDPRWTEFKARERQLLDQFRRSWNAPLHRMLSRTPLRGQIRSRRGRVKGWEYRRGFVEVLWVSAEAFLDHGDLLFQLGPIREVRLWGASRMDRIADSPHLTQLTTLDLRGNVLTQSEVRSLGASPYVGQLSTLILEQDFPNRPTELAIQTLAEMLPKLKVRLGANGVSVVPTQSTPPQPNIAPVSPTQSTPSRPNIVN